MNRLALPIAIGVALVFVGAVPASANRPESLRDDVQADRRARHGQDARVPEQAESGNPEDLHEAGLAESRTEARKLIRGGGARLNDKPIASDTATVGEADLDSAGTLKLSAGRKRHVLVKAA